MMKTGKKMNTYLKYGLILLAAMLVGGFIGIGVNVLYASGSTGVVNTFFEGLLDALQRNIFLVEVILLLLTIAVSEGVLQKVRSCCKQIFIAEDEEGDSLEYQEEKLGGMGVVINTASQALAMIALAAGYSIRLIESETFGRGSFLLACITFLVLNTYNGYWQVRYVKIIQKTYPDKKGDPASRRFQKDWLESCDEVEKQLIFRSAYKTYTLQQKLLPLLMVFFLLTNLLWETGILPIVALGVVWIAVTVTYTRSCVSLRKNGMS